MQIARVDAPRCRGGEGPLWDVAEQVLWYLDNLGQRLHRYHPASGRADSWPTPSIVSAAALRASGGLVVTLMDGIKGFDPATGAFTLLDPLDADAAYGYNDGAVDRHGRFIVGASTKNHAAPAPDGGLFRFDPDHRMTRLDQGIHYSNGPCWSPDGATLYFSDSLLHTIYAYDYRPADGSVANRRVFATTRELGGVPDGATVDREGRLWTAIYGGGRIACFAVDGALLDTIAMPAGHMSSVAFGGADLTDLYATSIDHAGGGGGGGGGGDDGALFVIRGLGAQGMPEPAFAG